MIVVKDLRVNALGEPLFEKVNLVIRPGERIALVGSQEGDVSTLLRVLAGEEDADRGTVASEGERTAYVPPEMFLEGGQSLGRLHHTRPTFLYFDATSTDASDSVIQDAVCFIEGFRGGILLAAADDRLIYAAKVSRVFEMHATTASITSYTGNYADFCIEREKSLARLTEAYEKQQKEKRRLEEYLEQKRKEAAKKNSSPEKGAVVRAKAKYLQREILDKEIPKPTLSNPSDTEQD